MLDLNTLMHEIQNRLDTSGVCHAEDAVDALRNGVTPTQLRAVAVMSTPLRRFIYELAADAAEYPNITKHTQSPVTPFPH